MVLETEIGESEATQRYYLIQHKVKELRIGKVWNQFVEAGFEPILIKGWSAAQLYPKPWQRQYVDLDLVFHPDDFERAQIFQRENSFDLVVDLHRSARHLDSLPFETLFENSVKKKCGEVEIRIPCEEDHLRILCVHWLNDGGAYRERLWDIFYAVENRAESFDWEKCLQVVNEKRRYWIICAIGLAHQYLDLKIDDTPFAGEIQNLPKWLIKAVEKEWADEVRLQPIQYYWHNKKQFWQQIKKRIPPNPIQATIELEGYFDKRPRFIYQFGDIFYRIYTSYQRRKQLRIGR